MKSAEAPTECPQERKAAHVARDMVMEYGTIANYEDAAARVFAHAECEAAVLDRMSADTGAAPIEARLRPVRTQYLNAMTLYMEVQRYRSELWSVAANAGLADLDLRFATKLRDSELDDLAAEFSTRASRSYALVLRAVERRPSFPARYPEAGVWLAQACAATGTDQQHPACH